MRKTGFSLVALTIGLAFVGCGPVASFDPFYTYKDLTGFEDRLVGDWKGKANPQEGKSAYLHLHVERHAGNSYAVEISMKPPEDKKDTEFRELTWKLWGNLFRYKGSQFMDLECWSVHISDAPRLGMSSDGIFFQMAAHTVYRLDIDKDIVRTRFLDKGKVEKFISDKDRALAAGRENSFALVGPSVDLQAKLLSHAEESNLYSEEFAFVREKKKSE